MIDAKNYLIGTTVSFYNSEIRRGRHCPCPCRISIHNYRKNSSSSSSRRTSTKMACIKLGFQSKPSDGAVRIVSGDEKKKTSKMGLIRVMNMGVNCFKDQAKKGPKKVGSDHGRSEDLISNLALVDGNVVPDHLVIMVNGIIGSAEDWRYAAEQFVKKLPDKVIVHRSKCNSATLTFDGVDLMGERLAEEVLSVVRRMPGVQKISFVAHSLGGLVARYAIGRLYEPCPDGLASVHVAENLRDEHSKFSEKCRDHPHEGRIAGLVPMNFITVASPHLGSRGNKQLPILCGLPFLEKHASQTAHWIAGRTGKHLFLTDNDDGRSPLLLRMVNDCEDLKFISALRSFKRRVAYANANYDYMVGWRTSSIRRQRELPQPHLLVKYEKYPHIVYVERGNAVDIHTEASSLVKVKTFDLEEEMIRGLTQVSWERVDVNFQKSRQRLIAHNTIQVKSYWMHSDGAGVVFHMIDNFNL